MALEDHGSVEAGTLDRLPVDDHGAGARLVEPCEDVQDRGLAAAGMADHAGEFAARHRQPQIFEHRDLAAVGARIAFCDGFDGNEFLGHRAHSGNVTMRVKRARIWSSSMPTRPIRRMAMMTLVMERLFHSFQTK